MRKFSPVTQERMKRALDLVAAVVGLVVGGPALALAGLGVKIAHGGPVFYSQWRVGRNGWLFRVFKLRTMGPNAERDGQARFARSNDPRVLPGCRWMRKSHFDELPQLWNILLGQMSLVGPRPERPEVIEMLRPHLPRIEERLAGRPGLTGLAQVRNGYSNDLVGMQQKLTHDLEYLRKQSLWTDLRLILATGLKFWDRGAL